MSVERRPATPEMIAASREIETRVRQYLRRRPCPICRQWHCDHTFREQRLAALRLIDGDSGDGGVGGAA